MQQICVMSYPVYSFCEVLRPTAHAQLPTPYLPHYLVAMKGEFPEDVISLVVDFPLSPHHLPILLQGEVLLRYLQSRDEQLKVLHACHVDPTAGHLGKTRTIIYMIKERFMWHGMVEDVVNRVSVLFPQSCATSTYMPSTKEDIKEEGAKGVHFLSLPSVLGPSRHLSRKYRPV